MKKKSKNPTPRPAAKLTPPGENAYPRRRLPEIPLKKMKEVSVFLARIANEMYRREIEEGLGSRIANVLQILKGTLENSRLEEEIEALEKRLRALERKDESVPFAGPPEARA